MMGLALALFIGLFAFGGGLLGWNDVQGNVQLDKRTVLFLVPPKDPGVN